MVDEPYRSAGTGERGTPVPSQDASQPTADERGIFDTYQLNVLTRLLEYTKAQNPCWVFSWNRAEGDELAIGDWLDTQADIGGAGGVVVHDILSATHTDSTAAAVSRGSLITGQGVAATWSELVIGGAGTVLSSNGTDASWQAPTAVAHNMLSATHTDSAAAAAVRGDIITAQTAGAVWTRLAAGTQGMNLTMGANEPAWAYPVVTGITSAMSPYAPTAANHSIFCDTTGGNIVVNLPTAVGISGRIYRIKHIIRGGANTVTINASGAERIDGLASVVLLNVYQIINIQSDGANWYVLARI